MYDLRPREQSLVAGSAVETAIPNRSARPLRTADFRRIAENGFGDGANSYAYSAVWYDDHLYIGSNRHIMPLLVLNAPYSIAFSVPPVPLPEDYSGLDLRGQMWRYSIRQREWTRVYHAPLVPGYQGRMIPQAFGFRGMTVFKGRSDSRPAIYTVPTVGRLALESLTLRSIDGVTFEKLPAPRVKDSREPFGSFRAMTAFKDRLFVAPSASKPPPEAARIENGRAVYISRANTCLESAVLVSDDPGGGEWQMSSPPLFGDSTNTSIIDMTVCGDYLYAGTLNIRHGFQLWRTDGEGPPPHRWELVLDRGANRGAHNQAVLSMAEFNGELYVGTCIQNGGFDRVYQIGPAAAEILRVRRDGRWDLVVGDPRSTRQGLKIPTSGLRSGFNNPLCCYIWRLCAHEGTLYAGTCDNSAFAQFSPPESWSPHVRRQLDGDLLEKFLERLGGCELWRSTDGDNWLPVTRNGFGNRYNLGVRALVSTPRGLFVGTANPFGPQVAVRDGSTWKYQDNPRGGLEVWQGSCEPACERGVSGPIELETRPVQPARPKRRLTSAADRKASEQEYANLRHSYALLERALTGSGIAQNPFLRLATEPADLTGLNESVEEEIAAYFASEIRNIGYWNRRTITPAEACRALVAELASLAFGTPAADENRRVLLLGTGGDVLADVLAHAPDDCQVDSVSPEAWFPGDEAAYDLAICIEVGARIELAEFYERLAQSLKPGATAVVAEYLALSPSSDRTPDEVLLRAAAAAGLLLEEKRDVTAKTCVPFFEHSRSYFLIKSLLQQLDAEKHAAILTALPGGNAGLHSYWFFRFARSASR